MTAVPVAEGTTPVAPRPGIVKTLGVLNLIFAVLLAAYGAWSGLITLSMVVAGKSDEGASGPETKLSSAIAAMADPAVIRFGVIDLATSIPLQVVMFISGIGLINLRRWGARWWARGCWAKIARLILVWGYFLFGVVPRLSAGMGRAAVDMIRAQQGPVARVPPVGQLSLVYTVMLSALGVAMIVLGLLYPAISLWLLGRPGVKAAMSPPSSTSAGPAPSKEASPP